MLNYMLVGERIMVQVSGRVQKLGIIFIILIVGASYALFFYLQNITENNIKNRLFDEQKQKQSDSTKAISQHISSDLNSVMARLQGLANSAYFQNGLVSNNNSKRLLEENYQQMNSTIDRLFVLDKNNIVKMNLVPTGQKNFLGANVSYLSWIKETQTQRKPTFSDGYLGLDGKYRVGFTYPIINRETGQYIGLVGAVTPTESFFAKYGNIHNINSQFLVIYDRNATLLAVGASKTLVGKNFFGDYTQKFVNHNPILNNLTHSLLAGNPGYAVYDYGRGGRLTTQYPIHVDGIPTYFIQVVTPTASIYSQVNDVLSVQRLETFALIVGITVAIIVLIIFLIKWNSTLDNEVKRRTNELNESNRKLESANERLSIVNEQLKVHDKMQQEFINIAAHELKTPIQPIISLSDLLVHKIRDNENRPLIDTISRNARRLQRLSQDILEVTRIESQTLKLNKEKFNLIDVITSVIEDFNHDVAKKGSNVKVLYEPQSQLAAAVVEVEADKERITQVISNLLNNAINFTTEGSISINVLRQEEVVVGVEDTGTGIDPEILPRLFTKFATKSAKGGTGLGLFISKSIIEAHGGKMWAHNNNNVNNGKNRGATFYFSLPLMTNNKIQSDSGENGNAISRQLSKGE
jgi:signal transduction histidine kinase